MLTLLGKLLRNPRGAFGAALAIVRARLFLLGCRVRGVRVEGGRGLRIDGKLVVRGSGRLVLGENVRIGMQVTPWTYDALAVISVGDNTFLNGTRLGCAREISIGRDCIIAEARIMDTDFHSLRADRHRAEAPIRVKPVRIGDNVFIGAQVGILPGTEIGTNSVVGFGAVCSGAYPADVVIVGNPATVARPIPHDPRSAETPGSEQS